MTSTPTASARTVFAHIFSIAAFTLGSASWGGAFAQCEGIARALTGLEPGGVKTYPKSLKLENTVNAGPASNRAGIDTLYGSTSGLPNQSVNVHWYKDRVVAMFITWRPTGPDEFDVIKNRLLSLTGVPRFPGPLEGAVRVTCSGGINAHLSQSKIVRGGSVPDQPIIDLALVHPSQAAMDEELKGKDTKMRGPY